MKCPYRTITREEKILNITTTTVEFRECWEEKCPFYNRQMIDERNRCARVRKESRYE